VGIKLFPQVISLRKAVRDVHGFGSALSLDLLPPCSTSLCILSPNPPSNTRRRAEKYVTQAGKTLFSSSYKK